ncbi:hypothetical protein HPC49_29945 [Pyxidicoccus fallax]|uniref:Lipoprotein n=1 Tax=Pyxidicoccus fallax TaxID=394095 RepID=A0A848LU64_9BACT|nr:hypothetical protein [Pyxidicoccus fallax]NMO21326.1 hypothetical protein [Pyxidicoccus fallax]NPC82431.1 hypothetical protein [Pyxidicoccus fallax]
MKSPQRPRHAVLSASLLLLSVLSGCDDDGPPAPGPGPDAGTPGETWDGGYTVLEERGDWLDRGRLASCTFDSAGDPSTVACDDRDRFDLSQCNLETLAALEPHGVYLADLRGEVALSDGGTSLNSLTATFQLRSDGEPGTMDGRPLVSRDTGAGGFYLTGRSTTTPGPNVVTTLAGCQVPSPGILTGCFARCVDGRFIRAGTFEARRLPLRPEEPESSGGVRLASESRVELGEAVDVHVAKDHAYVVSRDRPGDNGGLTVFDVKDREHPVFKASIRLPGDSDWNSVQSKDDALYIASNTSGVHVYDIADPGAPRYVRHLPADGKGVQTVRVDGDRLYAVSMQGGTYVHDLSQPLNPTSRPFISVPEEYFVGGAHGAFEYEGRLYLSSMRSGYFVMDVTDLNDARYLGHYVHGGLSRHSAVGTFAGRTIAFEAGQGIASHVRMLDFTDPAHIVKIGEFRMSPVTSVDDLVLRGNRLYVAWHQEGLRVLDVSNPTKPKQVAHFNTYRESDPGHTDAFLQGVSSVRVPGDGYVYLADSVRGLLILAEP